MKDAFEEREKSEEAKYKLDQEQRFKVLSRRNKLLGSWAAERMGLSGSEAEAYAVEIIQAELVQRLLADDFSLGVIPTYTSDCAVATPVPLAFSRWGTPAEAG